MNIVPHRKHGLASACMIALVLLLGTSVASAETLLLPTRDFLMGDSEVVWGVTTQPNGTTFAIDFGDGAQTVGTVADRSYIAFNHVYPISGPRQ